MIFAGTRLLDELDNFLDQKPSDLLWLNPYSAYLGADVKNSEANNSVSENWPKSDSQET